MTRELHLNTNITSVGRHPAAWRVLDDPASFVDVEFFRTIARIAERGTLDAVFLSDGVSVKNGYAEGPAQALEPTVLLTAIAAVTERVGLIGTASSTYNDPFNLARRFASVDHISGGRVALNIVTTYDQSAAANFGLSESPSHEQRYQRANEFVDVVTKLWDSWEDDALIGDRDLGHFVDLDRLHPIDHRGEHFSVRGPLNVPRSPQGRPVLVQAGSSEGGRDLAGRHGEAIFTAQTTFEAGQEFYADIKARAVRYGRNPDHVVILPGLYPVVGSTEAEALARKAELDALVDIDQELRRLAGQLGVQPEDLVLDQRLPYDRIEAGLPAFKGSRGFLEATVRQARSADWTVREVLARNPGAHRMVIGGPEQIADDIEHWFEGRAADGFNLNADQFPTGLELFVDHVVPELRRRGLFRREYTGTTLREHLGLPRPESRYAHTPVLAAS